MLSQIKLHFTRWLYIAHSFVFCSSFT